MVQGSWFAVNKTKTVKTPLMMSEASGLAFCSSVLVPESKLSHGPEAQPGLVPRLIHHKWKDPGSVEPEKPEMTNSRYILPNTNHVVQVVISFENGR